jgi:hypothetical protein
MMAAYNPPIRCGIWGNPPTNKIDKHGGGYHFLFQLSPCACALSPATAPHNISRNNKMRKVKLANPLPCPYKGKLPSFRGLIFSAGVSMMESAPEKK